MDGWMDGWIDRKMNVVTNRLIRITNFTIK